MTKDTETMQTVGQPKNPHAFRSAVVTAFWTQAGATQSDMNMLAQIMAHDPATARNHYYRPQMSQAALQTNERMRQVLQLGTFVPEPPTMATPASQSESSSIANSKLPLDLVPLDHGADQEVSTLATADTDMMEGKSHKTDTHMHDGSPTQHSHAAAAMQVPAAD